MNQFHCVLAIESSCDDTSVALVNDKGVVLSISSVNQDLAHKPFGGIVPEVAGRNHIMNLIPVLDSCLKKANLSFSDIDAIAVTARPGLMGSLIVGVVTAKTLALAYGIPFIGINHLEGHLLAPFLSDSQTKPLNSFEYPYIALVVSGGHTHLYYIKDFSKYYILGQTIDDAAGEAFDKFAKNLGLDFPGGVQIDELAKKGSADAFSFPRPLAKEDNYKMSFSGLKTAGMRTLESLSSEDQKNKLADLCASYQEAIVDSLLIKLGKAVKNLQIKKVTITGGVSANSRLREKSLEWANREGIQLAIPPLAYCTDNAAMIGYAGIQRLNRGEKSEQNLGACPKSFDKDFIKECPKDIS